MIRETSRRRHAVRAVLIGATLVLAAEPMACQRAPRPRRSQPATVSQTVGDARLTITYNRPVARGRTLFGGIVRWGDTWCPGADEATALETTADLMFGGQRLPQGKYTIWAVPGESEWQLIFSNAVNVWHVPYPGADQDRMRVKLTPQKGPHMESLAFYFPMSDLRAATLRLHWGETFVEVPIEVP